MAPMILAGPKGGMGHLAMEGTRYLLELLSNPQSGTPKVQSESLNPNGQTYYLQLSFPDQYQHPSTWTVWVGTEPLTHLEMCAFSKTGDVYPEPTRCFDRLNPPANAPSWMSDFMQFTLNAGFLEVTLDYTKINPDLWLRGREERCVPSSFCKWSQSECVCSRTESDSLFATCQELCQHHGGVTNAECPAGGCLGFAFTVPHREGGYSAPYAGNATAWLASAAGRSLLKQWDQEIRDQVFTTPSLSPGAPCPVKNV